VIIQNFKSGSVEEEQMLKASVAAEFGR